MAGTQKPEDAWGLAPAEEDWGLSPVEEWGLQEEAQPAAPAPAAPVEKDVVKRLLKMGEKGGVRAKSLANDELDRRFQAALARGEDYLSVEDYVKRNLTGEKRAPELVEDPGAVISGAFSGLRRSKMWKPIEGAGKIAVNALLAPERIAPAPGESIASKTDELIGSELFGNLQAKASEVDRDQRRSEVDRVNSEIAASTQTAGSDNTAIPAMRQETDPGVMESLSTLVQQIKDKPGETVADLLGQVATPENLAAELLTGNAAAGLLSKAVRGAKMGARAARLTANPLEQAGKIGQGFSIPRQIISETAQGAGAEFFGTGDVTAHGTVENLIPAIAGTPVMRTMERMLDRKPKTAVAPGGETINAAPRTGTMDPPASAQEPAAPPAAPEPVQPVDQPALPAVAPEPVAPDAAPVPDAPEVPAEGMTSAVRKSKMSPDMKKAARIAKTENKQARSDAKAIRDDNLKMAEALAKRGQFDAAKDIVTKTRDLFEETTPGLADGMVTSYHKYFDDMKADIDAKAAAKKAKKPRASKMNRPKSAAEAQAVMQEAVATGTPEAIDAALPAAQVLAPVGDEAAKIIEDAKAQLPPEPEVAAPTMTEPVTPVKPTEPVTDLTETEKAAQKERPVISNGKTEIDHPSQEDWQVTPVVASRSAASIWGNKDNLAALRAVDPGLAGTVARSQKKLAMRQMETVGKSFEPVMDVLAQADEVLAEYGITMEDYLEERGAELNDFLKEKGIDRPTLDAAYHNVQATPTEQANFIRATAAMTGDGTQMDAAKVMNSVILGAGPFNPNTLSSLTDIAKSGIQTLMEQGARLERLSDFMTRIENKLGTNPAHRKAYSAIYNLNRMTRDLKETSDPKIARQLTKIKAAADAIPFEILRPKYLEAVTDALEGKQVKLDDRQQALHDALREAYDENGQQYQRVTGNPPRKNWVHRVEVKGLVNSAVNQIRDAVKGDAAAIKALEGPMTLEKAKRMPSEIKGQYAAEAVDNYTAELEKLFELKDGKVITVKDGDRDLIDSEAAYLKLIDEKGELDTFLPDLLEKRANPKDGKLEMTVVGKPPQFQRDWTPEDLKTLLRGEAIRLLHERHDYDPESGGTTGNFARRRGHWQADGSILFGRMLPYMGHTFYDRNPLNVASQIIPRQIRGLDRWEMFGKDKGKLLENLVEARGPLTDAQLGIAENEDGTLRLADHNDKGLYEDSLLRTYEDVAMGYLRPFTEDGAVNRIAGRIGNSARSMVLMRKFSTSLANEAAGLQMAQNMGPEVAAMWIAQRARVVGMRQASSARRMGARVARTVGARDVASGLISKDPMTAADAMAMADNAGILGTDRLTRLGNQIDQISGSFGVSSHDMDVTGHFVGQKLFEDMVYNRGLDVEGFASDAGIPNEIMKSTMRDEVLDKASELLDSQGFPKDREAALKLIELARPFVSEFKSRLTSAGHPLFQVKAMRSRPFRTAMWLAMTPLALQSAAIADLMRAYVKVENAQGGAVKARAIAELTKRGGLQQFGALANGALKIGLRASAGTAGLAVAAGMGAYPALLAGQGLFGDYTPDTQNAEAKWEELKSSNQVLSKLLKTSMEGQIFVPRFMQVDMLSDEKARLAGVKRIPKMGLDIGNAIAPQVGALYQGITKSADLAKLAYTGGSDNVPMSGVDRFRAGVASVPIMNPFIIGREYLGKDLRAWKNIQKRTDTNVLLDKEKKKIEALKDGSAPGLMGIGVGGKMTDWKGSGTREGTF